MLINDASKRVIPFRPRDVKSMGEGCFFLDQIVWLSGDRIVLGDRVGFNYGCYVNGYGGLTIGDDTNIGPMTLIHTANHNYDDIDTPILQQGHTLGPVTLGANIWIGMGSIILPGVTIADGVIVGAGGVVVKDLEEPNTIYVGNPARPVKSRR